eukprot:CAMPEP_0171428104 /NCGR_PEP_ID=MMETSP0881-20121228/5033_1 /TAXON_ID=67004 /ORGANISM="Thalassiosira weissflogii, Strain CCMP1336" /LENGTH=539 /DNA_ID=CAMNT_0011947855 /DNA_START=59 /DNA_END=1678 /DNA_ORIENTATION=-
MVKIKRAPSFTLCIVICSHSSSAFVTRLPMQQEKIRVQARSKLLSLPIDDFERRQRVNTFLQSTEKSSIDTDNPDYDDEDESAPWVLRQITFLGLSAPDTDDNGQVIEKEDGAALDVQNLSDFLMDIGACSVSITDADAETEEEDPLFDEPSLTTCVNDLDDDEMSEKELNEWAVVINDVAAGRNIWKRCDVTAHFPSSMFDVSSIVDSIRYTFHCPSNPRYKVDNVPDRDWIKHVQESWTPIVTRESKFVLRFPWHEDKLVMQACQNMEREKMQEAMAKQFSSGVKREGAVVHFESNEDDPMTGVIDLLAKQKTREYVQIQLEGGIAFGTGEHPTTQLCLDWVRDKVEEQLENDYGDNSINFIDYGAGSGVLGIAAAAVVRDFNQNKRRSKKEPGATKSINAVGVEIDADAIHIANNNAKMNQVEMVNYLPTLDSLDGESLSVVMRAIQKKRNKALKSLPDEMNGPIFDLCVANILAEPLVSLAPTIASLVKSGGEIGLSGVLATKADSVADAYQIFFDDVTISDEEGGWVLITGKRK